MTLPWGNPDSMDTSMGSLWCDEENERLVVFDDFENFEDYRVYIYLKKNGRVQEEVEYWDDETIAEFIHSSATAYLAGHNYPGCGEYGVVSESKPDCPVCGESMKLGTPDYSFQQLPAVGFICEEYEKTNGAHEGYMTQEEAIQNGFYIPVDEYIRRRWG